MARRAASDLAMTFVALIGAAGCFVSTTVLMEELPNGLLVAAAGVGALLVAAAQVGPGTLLTALKSGGPPAMAGIAGGAASFAVAPLIVLSQRASDAPPGTEVLLFTTSSWGLLVCIAALAVRRPPRSMLGVAASLIGGVGGVAVLANWERPSSLSPFVRFPTQHVVMLLAGVVFALGAIALMRASRSLGAPLAAALAGSGAAAVGVIAAIPALNGTGDAVNRTGGALVVLAVFGAMFLIGWVRTSSAAGLTWASVALTSIPAALTGLSVIERALSVYGPNPIRWTAAASGIALTLAAAGALWFARKGAEPRGAQQELRVGPLLNRGLLLVATVVLALAAASLGTGALEARIAGAFSETYEASWTMLGVESAVGWLALAAAVCAAAAAADLARGLTQGAAVTAVLAMVAPFAYPFLADTPLRTATRWVPADVQQTLGTEYARITFMPHIDPLRLIALAASAGLGVAVLIVVVRARRAAPESKGTT